MLVRLELDLSVIISVVEIGVDEADVTEPLPIKSELFVRFLSGVLCCIRPLPPPLLYSFRLTLLAAPFVLLVVLPLFLSVFFFFVVVVDFPCLLELITESATVLVVVVPFATNGKDHVWFLLVVVVDKSTERAGLVGGVFVDVFNDLPSFLPPPPPLLALRHRFGFSLLRNATTSRLLLPPPPPFGVVVVFASVAESLFLDVLWFVGLIIEGELW